MLYKGFVIALCGSRNTMFSPSGFYVFEMAKVHHGMPINIMLFDTFECLFTEITSKCIRNEMFNKGSVTAFSSTEKHLHS